MSIVVRTLSDQLVQLVRDRILSGHVPAGSPIRQDALAAELGISKIPLREALARLEQEGLVQSHANRGFFVRALNAAEAEEVYALRLKLEPEATVVASILASEAERKHAADALAAFDHVTAQGGGSVGAFSRAFHRALLRPAQQPITLGILERLHVLSERYLREHLEPLGRGERANEQHHELLDAWLARDLERVGELTSNHIQSTLSDLRVQLTA